MLTEECNRVEATLHAPPTMLEGEPKLLRRMVRNLLENARRHGDGAPIALQLQREAAATPTCQPEHGTQETLRLSVCDTGPGVLPNERENIFIPFYRLPGARERNGSVGLGLSLVRQIARRHGGEVRCLPRAGQGTCFEVTLRLLAC